MGRSVSVILVAACLLVASGMERVRGQGAPPTNPYVTIKVTGFFTNLAQYSVSVTVDKDVAQAVQKKDYNFTLNVTLTGPSANQDLSTAIIPKATATATFHNPNKDPVKIIGSFVSGCTAATTPFTVPGAGTAELTCDVVDLPLPLAPGGLTAAVSWDTQTLSNGVLAASQVTGDFDLADLGTSLFEAEYCLARPNWFETYTPATLAKELSRPPAIVSCLIASPKTSILVGPDLGCKMLDANTVSLTVLGSNVKATINTDYCRLAMPPTFQLTAGVLAYDVVQGWSLSKAASVVGTTAGTTTMEYTVKLAPTTQGPPTNPLATLNALVTNFNFFPVDIKSPSFVTHGTVTCKNTTVVPPGATQTIPPGGQIVFQYSCSLPAVPKSPLNITGTISWGRQASLAASPRKIADLTLPPPTAPTNVINHCIGAFDKLTPEVDTVPVPSWFPSDVICFWDGIAWPKTYKYTWVFPRPATGCTTYENVVDLRPIDLGPMVTFQSAKHSEKICASAPLPSPSAKPPKGL